MAKLKKSLRALIPKKPSAKPKPKPAPEEKKETREEKIEKMEKAPRDQFAASREGSIFATDLSRGTNGPFARPICSANRTNGPFFAERKIGSANWKQKLEEKREEKREKIEEKVEKAEGKAGRELKKEEAAGEKVEEKEVEVEKEKEKPAEEEAPAPAPELDVREISGENIETIIDRIVEFVKAKDRVNVREVAKALALKSEQVENLLNVLEESGLVSVRYSIMGNAELVAKKSITERIEVVKAKKESELIREAIKHAEMELKDSEQTLRFMEKGIARRLDTAEKLLETVRAQEKSASSDDIDYLMKEARELEMTLEKFNIGMKSLRARAFTFAHKIKEFEGATEAVTTFPQEKQARPSPINMLLSPFERIRRLFARRSP